MLVPCVRVLAARWSLLVTSPGYNQISRHCWWQAGYWVDTGDMGPLAARIPQLWHRYSHEYTVFGNDNIGTFLMRLTNTFILSESVKTQLGCSNINVETICLNIHFSRILNDFLKYATILCIHYSKYRSPDWGSLLATDPTLPLTFGAPLVRAHQAEHGTRIQDVSAA